MTWEELPFLKYRIKIELINPVRKGEEFRTGELIGWKAGLIGGGHSDYRHGVPYCYDSSKRRELKKIKVFISYGVWGNQKQYNDWVDYDNCIFTVEKHKNEDLAKNLSSLVNSFLLLYKSYENKFDPKSEKITELVEKLSLFDFNDLDNLRIYDLYTIFVDINLSNFFTIKASHFSYNHLQNQCEFIEDFLQNLITE